ncbi:MAG: Omp28-related outer membrane protein [Rikenellaceae bacterium]|nr:Omp28-related outer membrane protein [Rikenellaceae bacterium]
MKKFFSLIALIVMAATITSCNPTPTPEPTPETLTASVTPSEITADGTSKAVFTVKYGDKAVSSVKAYVNGVETALTNLTFTTKTAGTYKFYFTYEWTSGKTVKSNEVSVTAKAAQASGDGSGLTMSVDNTIIQVNKGRATFTIKYNGKIVESAYKIYKNGTETSLPTTEVTIDGKKYKQPYFESKTTGTFSFYVTYNITESTKNSPVIVQVNNDAIPDRAEDPNPSSTSFKRRAMVMQFTGTNCGYCPYMIRPLETLAADADYKNKFTWAAIHTFNPESDPAAPHNKVDKQQLGSIFGISGYPTVLVDYSQVSFAHNDAVNLGVLKKAIDNSMANPASAGISATMTYDEANRVVTARVSVKAKDPKVYNVGMWVIEDKIAGGQNGDTSIKSHDNAVRYVARGTDGSVNYKGYELNDGKAMTAGQVVDYIFTVKLAKDDSCDKQPDMKPANGQLLFFVTTSTGNSYTVVNSVVSKDLKTAVPFEYTE